MDEYISREAVLQTLQKANIGGYITERLLEIPSADVQPVKHGRWKYYENNGIIDTYICTNCQGKVEMAIDVDSSSFKYCPNCGAIMDGDTNG